MLILKVRYRTNREFLDSYQTDLENGGIFYRTTSPLEAGRDVICELSIPALLNKVLIGGAIKSWRPALPREHVLAGAIVEFAREEAEKSNFIVETVRNHRDRNE